MRTRLTIDEDIAAQLKRLQCSRQASLKELVNDALRRGLRDMAAAPRKGRPFRTQTFDAGKPLIDIDNVSEVLAVIKGDGCK